MGDKLMTAGAFLGAFVALLRLSSPTVTEGQRLFRLALAATSLLLLAIGAVMKFRAREKR